MLSLAPLLLLLSLPLAVQAAAHEPTVSIGDPASLSDVIDFAPPPASLHGYGGSRVLWRADVHVPAGMSVQRVDVSGYAPIHFTMRDGRCYKLDFNGAGQALTKADLIPDSCWPGKPAGASGLPTPPRAPADGLVYVGRAWNLNAWTDRRSGRTMLVPDGAPDARPVLTTTMRVLAVGGLGSPDAPMTEVSLVGYVHGRLIAATVMLTLP